MLNIFMTRIRSLFLILLSLFIFAGCQNSQPPCNPKEQSRALASLTDSLSKSLDWPDDLDMNVFSGPDVAPDPASMAVAPTGEVYVGVDKIGSLGKKMGEGAIVRIVDCNHDGIMDTSTVFTQVDNPRGIIPIGDEVYVLHTTFSKQTGKATGMALVKFEDKDHDGKADGEPQMLISHMSNPNYLRSRGTDHATNGIRMGIDGWIYIAVGDFGFHNAVSADGTKLTMLGGGIVRVRPDGSEMEVYTHGMRNIYDVAIDPFMNIFTHGNTNDGGGWNVRFAHHIESGEYGYPMLFKHFTEEILPALVDMGGGSGTGALYMDDDRWPDKYNNVPMMADWGRSYLYMHHLTKDHASFTQKAEKFIEIPQITDVDVDASGTLYLSAWDGAGFSGDSSKGFTVRAVPKGMNPKGFPSLQDASIDELSQQLQSGSAKARLYAQYELLQRSKDDAAEAAWAIANNKELSPKIRVAGIFTYAQAAGADGIDNLVELTKDNDVKEFALRALADRKPHIDQVPIEPFLAALNSSSDRIKIAAMVGLGRLGRKAAVEPLLKTPVPASFKTPKPGTIGPHATPNSEIIPAHIAVRSLLKIGAVDPLLDAVENEHNELAMWALRYIHEPKVPEKLIELYKNSDDADFKNEIIHNLARIYHKEAPYDGSWWWSTRPDTHGPYYKAIGWQSTPLIRDFLINEWQKRSASGKKMFAVMNSKYRLGIDQFGGVEPSQPKEEAPVVDLDKIKSKEGQVGKASIEDVMLALDKLKGDSIDGQKIFTQQGCPTCHSIKNSQVLKGPYLGQIGAIMNKHQIAESILKPNASISQGFATVQIKTKDGKSLLGFVSEESANDLVLRDISGNKTSIDKSDIASRKELRSSMMPTGLANSLSYEQFTALVDFLSKQKK